MCCAVWRFSVLRTVSSINQMIGSSGHRTVTELNWCKTDWFKSEYPFPKWGEIWTMFFTWHINISSDERKWKRLRCARYSLENFLISDHILCIGLMKKYFIWCQLRIFHDAKENIWKFCSWRRMMQVLIDQTNKKEIADWLLQKYLPIILCNSIFSTIEVHPGVIIQI